MMESAPERTYMSCGGVIHHAPRDKSLGNVGYRFSKHFPGHGYFDGTVVQIRPDAALGKDRRCVYSDGDLEDLSLSELHALARTEERSGRKAASTNHNNLWEAGDLKMAFLNAGNSFTLNDSTTTTGSIVVRESMGIPKYNMYESLNGLDSSSRAEEYLEGVTNIRRHENKIKNNRPTINGKDAIRNNNSRNNYVEPKEIMLRESATVPQCAPIGYTSMNCTAETVVSKMDIGVADNKGGNSKKSILHHDYTKNPPILENGNNTFNKRTSATNKEGSTCETLINGNADVVDEQKILLCSEDFVSEYSKPRSCKHSTLYIDLTNDAKEATFMDISDDDPRISKLMDISDSDPRIRRPTKKKKTFDDDVAKRSRDKSTRKIKRAKVTNIKREECNTAMLRQVQAPIGGATNPRNIDIFASACELLPIDIAAEYTVELQKKFIKEAAINEQDKSEDWLQNIASLLGAANSTSAYRLKTRKTADVATKYIVGSSTSSVIRGNSQTTTVSNGIINPPKSEVAKKNKHIADNLSLGDVNLPKPSHPYVEREETNDSSEHQSIKCMVPQKKNDHLDESDDDVFFSSHESLSTDTKDSFSSTFSSLIETKSGERHGLKVFNIHDEKRRVGEVLMEHQNGWVEAILNGESKKRRVRHLVVVPDHYEMGDEVDIQIPLPDTNLDAKSVLPLKNLPKATSDEYCSTKPPSTTLRKLPTTIREENRISIDNFFYWRCVCKAINKYTDTKCAACDCRRSESCSPSALLDMAEHAVNASTTYEEVLESVPLIHSSSLPKIVLKNLMPSTTSLEISPSPFRLDDYFYWNCYSCTMTNSYKRVSCEACKKKNDSNTTSSILLHIAKEAALKAQSVEEALLAVPPVHAPAIPEIVLKSLVTCNAITSQYKRRCLKQKAPNSEFCQYHTDPTMINKTEEPGSKSVPTDEILSESEPDVIDSAITTSQKVSNAFSQDIISVQSSLSKLFHEKIAPHHVNKLQWNIHCIEDAIISQDHSPFPLGMRIRRFFPNYGFHDGTITRIIREIVEEHDGKSRPMLLYRILYNDGDSEDVFHHHINSLRQFYDQCNVDSTAPFYQQLLPGTLYETFAGNVEIVKMSLNQTTHGKVSLKVFRPDEPWSTIVLYLTQLQLIVVRKVRPDESVKLGPAGIKSHVVEECIPENHAIKWGNENNTMPTVALSHAVSDATSEVKTLPAPVLEWPSTGRPIITDIQNETSPELNKSASTDQKNIPAAPGLWISREPFTEDPYSSDDESHESDFDCKGDDECCVRPGVKCSGWDPAGGLHSVVWDPYKVLICEVCKSGKDETRILICDECNSGYHMYCVRPVIVNIPSEQWLCIQCSGGKQTTFADTVDELMQEPSKISSFLSFPFNDPSYFCIFHKESLDIFSPTAAHSKKLAVLGPLSDSKPTRKVGALHVSRTKNRKLWILPVSLSDPNHFCQTLATMVAAMKYCGMETYCENLVYDTKKGVTEAMNDTELDLETVGPLSKINLGVFARYKENLKAGVYPPIRIVNDDKMGFTVEAMACMPRHTIITEYIGEVTTIENSYDTSSDSLMTLLDTGDPKTSLIIDPTKQGNIARFLNGINNRSYISRRKANVRSRRFSYEGVCRVVLFTSKQVDPGDGLHYDYNAGNEGKSVAEWADSGFYDTSNFM